MAKTAKVNDGGASWRRYLWPIVRHGIVVGAFFAAAGTMGWFSLVYTIHLGTVSVPELRGLNQREAERKAHDLGLVVDFDQAGVFSEDVAAGLVAAQNPPPGFQVKAGSIVKVNWSLGDEQVEVPAVRGETSQAAIRVLEEAGLTVRRRVEINGFGSNDSVVETAPAVASLVLPETEIDILTNRTPDEPMWVMPSLVSQSLTSVRRFCRNHRFRLGRIHEVEYPGIPTDLVLRQYPPAGSPFSRSDIITLWISQ